MLETIREFARERLEESGEGETLRGRHAGWCLELASPAETELHGPKRHEWLDRLELEHDNLRIALRGMVERGEALAALRLAGALVRFWRVRGHFSEGRERLARVLSEAGASGPTATRANALSGMSSLARDQGDYASARSLGDESLAMFRQLGDQKGIAQSLNVLGVIVSDLGDYESARIYYEESLRIYRELDHRGGIAAVLGNLGHVACLQGDYALARSLHEESLAIRRELGDKIGITWVLNYLGIVLHKQGDRAGARSLQEECLAICHELGHKRGVAECFEVLAEVAGGGGYPERAACLWGAAEVLREALAAPMRPHARADYDLHVGAARVALGEEAFAAAWAEGRAMTLEDAIAAALAE